VVAYDFDDDGDQDLFAGSRSIPLNYGPAPRSFILQNDGKGKFSDITVSAAPDIASIGLVTGACWANLVGDEHKELVIAGEWMTPRIFTYSNKRFVESSSTMNNLYGWWQAVSAADLDGDGDEDLVLGNFGENFYLHPTQSEPVKLWINDFDKNGSTEKILTRTIDQKDMPVFLKRDLTDQIVSLKKQNLKYEEFGKKSFQQLFDPALVNSCDVKKFDYTSSCIAINEGNGKFTIQPLPQNLQLSTINAILCTDINADGKTDIIAAGNRFDLLPQFGRLDASFGHVLLNKGKGQWEELGSQQSGMLLDGQVRDLEFISGRKDNYIVVLQNNDYPVMYRLKKK
jgi:hypothetical protein